jgi:PKD repeat protein
LKTFSQAGTYTVTATVTDAGGASTSKEITFTVGPNNAPVVSTATVTPTTQAAPASFTFKTTATDVDKQALTYAWVFADGSKATGVTAALKNLTTPGTYTATVTVRDTGGLTATKTVSYTVTPNNAPVVSVATVTPTAMAAPASFSFTATGADVDKQALTYAWVFADGSKATTQTARKIVTAPGTYTATVTVRDTGGLTATKTVSYTVTPNNAPVVVSASVTAASLPAGQSRTFSASSSDADNQVLTYKWVFGDGSTSIKASAAKTFVTPGTYTATVTVRDTGGLTATRAVAYTVT